MSETEELSEDEFAERVEEVAPTGFDRTSEETARVVLEKLLPQEEARLEVLSFFAQAILIAHQQGESKWGVTLYPNAVALNVSGFYACWIRSSDFFVSLMENALAPEARATLEDKVKWDGAFKRLPGSRWVYVPYAQTGKALPQLVAPTEEFIVFTATRYARMGARVEGAHSPGVLKYLREYLEMDLPEPVYTSASDVAALFAARRRNLPASDVLETVCLKDPNLRTVTPTLAAAMAVDSGIVQGTGIPCMVSIGTFMCHARIVGFDSRPDERLEAKYGLELYPGIAMIRESTGTDVWHKLSRRTVMIAESLARELEKAPRIARPNTFQDAPDALGTRPVGPSPPLIPSVPEAVKPLLRMAGRTRNILLYGPPGTGKTWLVTQFAKAFTDPDKAEMVTFHQSFAYEEFVEGIKPVNDERGQVLYRIEKGVFKNICHRAVEDPNGRFLLIIDEINRANIAKVLGELITLIEDDKRLGMPNEVRVTLPYSGERFGVPANLTILGTMNTADRSIALLDLALRRRFTFVEMPPDPKLLSTDVAGVNLRALLTRLNKSVGALLDPDHRIGHSYLMGVETAEDLHFAWYRRVVPLLQEYFYHDGERLQAVVGKAFVKEVTLDPETTQALGMLADEGARYEVVELTGKAFLDALRGLVGQ